MNRALETALSLAAVALLFGCGNTQDSPAAVANITRGDSASSATAEGRTLRATPGSFAGVKVKAGQAGSFATYAQVNYMVACYEQLEAVSAAVTEHDGRFTVYFSGVVSEVSMPADAVRCRGLSLRTTEVALASGIIGREAVDVVSLDLMPTSMNVEGQNMSLEALAGAEVTGVRPLCPSDSGVNCVVNGTVATVTFARRCSLKEGPMGYAISALEGNKVRVSAVAYGLGRLDPAAPSCQAFQSQTMTVTLVNTYVDAEDIELVTLR